ncbi:MAG: PD-(D/E)XK nuclease family protein [Solirubrobacteraceae bacterium]
MSLTLVLGPANSAKAGEVLGAYAAAARRGGLLVVPTAADARHYALELAHDGVVLGSVLTFGGLAGEIARRAQYTARRVSALQRERLIASVLAAEPLDALGPAASAAGLAAPVGELIAELTRSLITPQRFRGALRAWSAQDVSRAPYARALGRIYAAYVQELDRRGRVDRELHAWRALDALRERPGRWGDAPVLFYGFDDLTVLQRDAVETLARVVGVAVTVSLTYESGREALAARAETVAELTAVAERVLELPALEEHYLPGSRAALHHLERNLFRPDASVARIDPGEAVVLLEAGGERAEAELVAQQVLALLRDGVPAPEIAVVHRSLGRAAPLYSRVFAGYGIAVSAGVAPPLRHVALGRGLLGAARCALAPARATVQDLLAYLRTPGVLQVAEIADGLEAQALRSGARTAAQAREQLGWELGELTQLAAAPDPARALCRLAWLMLAGAHRERGASEGKAPLLDDAERLDARALATLVAAVDELDELELAPHGEELIELLAGLPVVTGAADSDRSGGVLLAEPLQVRARRFRAVFVCGLQEGEFPLPGRPEPFLSDDQRFELAVASGLRLAPAQDALAAERHLFYAAVSRAAERVFLAWRSSDEEGNVALASPFIADVCDLFVEDWPARRRRRLLADVVWPARQAPTERELRRALAAASAPVAGEQPGSGRVLGRAALSRVRHLQILSAGALEKYGACPVKWLVQGELQPAALAPDDDPLIRGSLIHEVLERLLRELDEPIGPASLQRAGELLATVLADCAEAAPIGAGASEVVRAGALAAIEADLRRWLGHEARGEGGWRPAWLERRFGFDDESSLPALTLGDTDEPVLVRGVIDRIDVDGHGHAVVLDYKSGTSRDEWPAAKWASQRQLQAALYMLVVRELTDLDPVGGLYQPLRGGDLRARGVHLAGIDVGVQVSPRDARGPDELRELLDDAAARAMALAASLRAGELTPCPQTCSRDGCAYPAICRSQ